VVYLGVVKIIREGGWEVNGIQRESEVFEQMPRVEQVISV
jgi:hypothetical protein